MPDLLNLRDKVVCVIGGTGLIGNAAVKMFLREGARVFIGSRKATVIPAGTEHLSIDVRDVATIKKFIADIVRKAGRIDVWVNVAWPIAEDARGPLEDVAYASISQDVQDHLVGFYTASIEIFRQMKEQDQGVILNCGSIYGSLSPDFRIYEGTRLNSSPAYSMIKGGIHGFTRYLACYAAPHNIRVNAVCPGGVFNGHSEVFIKNYSARVPMARMARPDEVAAPILFLSSDASSYMTGQLIFVDGGLSAW